MKKNPFKKLPGLWLDPILVPPGAGLEKLAGSLPLAQPVLKQSFDSTMSLSIVEQKSNAENILRRNSGIFETVCLPLFKGIGLNFLN